MNRSAWLHLVLGFAPLVAALIPGGAAIAPFLGAGIAAAEQIPGASGADKKAHALALVAASVASVNATAGHVVIDPDTSAVLASGAIDTTVAAVNLVHAAHPPAA